MRFFKKKEVKKIEYDKEKVEPVLRVSICTGEKTAGFQDRDNGKFHEYILIKNDNELAEFKEACSVTELKTIY